ncbi:hypothetical protein D3H55_23165 [Bacillus salacetis]|uniref:Uncharacterized protein n=1 Tax=Bacillus salacetis TaxID=2315464 RepID=A0A3A1QQM5_9BACI|nr:hypothetical protein D3H55_23165 [Bacillus salacetis]
MFFKTNKNINKKYLDMACWSTFIVWGTILLLNSIFELISNKPLISSDLIILLMGLVTFITTEYLLKLIKK